MILRACAYGAIAGAAGTAVLNAVSYADMAIRGRPPSSLPENMVAELARRAGLHQLAKPSDELAQTERNRRTGLAALLGYADGIGAGVLFGLVRSVTPGASRFWGGIGLALATMLFSEGTATAMGQTDPRTWGASGWIEDIVPRCLYGWTAAISFDLLADAR